MPLSEEEQRILQEMERALQVDDPALVDRVRTRTVYRHAGRASKWAALAFLAGLALLLASFATSVVAGFAGFLVMLFAVVLLERNLRRLGRAGWHDLSPRARGVTSNLSGARRRLSERFHRRG